MNYILLAVSVAFFALNTVSLKFFQSKIKINSPSVRFFQAMSALVAAASGALFRGLTLPSVATLLFGLAFGLLFFLTAYSTARCFACGPMSLTSVIINMSLSVPIVYSFFVFDEAIIPRRTVGLCLMLLSIVFSGLSQSGKGDPSSEKRKKGGLVWLMFVLLGFLSNGFASVVQKENQFKEGAESASTFLAIGYLFASILFIITFFVENKGKMLSPKKDVRSFPFMIVLALLAGLGSIVGQGLLGTLSTKIDASVLYPCLNGGLALTSSAVSIFAFREKATPMKLLSLGIGLAAIVLLAM